MLWPLPGKLGGVTIAGVYTVEPAPASRRRGRHCCRWSGQARHGSVLRSAIGIALQHPYRRMAAHGLLGRRPLHPRGGARHQLDPARPRLRRDPADERRRPRRAGAAARSPRHARSVPGGVRLSLADDQSAALSRRRRRRQAQLSHQGHGGRSAQRAAQHRADPRCRAEPQMRRCRLLPAIGLCPRRLRPGPPVARARSASSQPCDAARRQRVSCDFSKPDGELERFAPGFPISGINQTRGMRC